MTGMNSYTLAAIAAGWIICMSVGMGAIAAILDSGAKPFRTSVVVAIAYAAGIVTALVAVVLRTS